jgi:putative hydrolase of the HAD superfamily
MVIVFDLDDTLYEELSFVRSGFKAVANYLSPIMGVPSSQILEELNTELQIQREKVFDHFLFKHHMKGQKWVRNCVSIYRGHEPALTLFPEARTCLIRLQEYPLYIVTDGNHLVQRRKFYALGLDLLVRRCFFTYAHGLHRRKPSPYCFEKICDLENVSPSSVVYVADNPHKDFVGIKPLGFQTIRVLTGPYAHDKVEPSYEADWMIPNLQALDETFLTKFHSIGQMK